MVLDTLGSVGSLEVTHLGLGPNVKHGDAAEEMDVREQNRNVGRRGGRGFGGDGAGPSIPGVDSAFGKAAVRVPLEEAITGDNRDGLVSAPAEAGTLGVGAAHALSLLHR